MSAQLSYPTTPLSGKTISRAPASAASLKAVLPFVGLDASCSSLKAISDAQTALGAAQYTHALSTGNVYNNNSPRSFKTSMTLPLDAFITSFYEPQPPLPPDADAAAEVAREAEEEIRLAVAAAAEAQTAETARLAAVAEKKRVAAEVAAVQQREAADQSFWIELVAADRVAAAAQQAKATPVTPTSQRKRRRSYRGEAGELDDDSDIEFEREGTPEGWSEAPPSTSTFPLALSRGHATSLVLAMRTARIVRE